MQRTSSRQRVSRGVLLKGWQPSAADLQLLRTATEQSRVTARLLELAAEAQAALAVQWDASSAHLTLLSPWEVCVAALCT